MRNFISELPVSRLDVIYRKLLITKFFTKGWGCPDGLIRLFNFRKVIADRNSCCKLVPRDYQIKIISEQEHSDCRVLEGRFWTPFREYLPELVPLAIQQVFFQMVIPKTWPSDNYRPVVIHLAGTGDHFFWRRRNLMAKPLVKQGISSIILENPFYGFRKPKDQIRSSLHYVSDIFVMGGCLILECAALLHWCERLGFGPLGVTGISMGGHMASLAASNWPKPLVLVPCLSWSTASSVFTEGVLSESINWDMLQKQLFSNSTYCETLSKSCKIVDSPIACSLSKIPEYGLNSVVLDKMNASYVSPYELMTIPDGNGQDISHKSEATTAALLKKSLTFTRSQDLIEMRKRDKEAVWLMRGLMDEFTHLKNFPVPFDPSLVISVCAESDGYVPRVGVSNLEEIWPGSTVKYVDTGHVGAYIWYRKLFRECIMEGFEKAKKVTPLPGPFIDPAKTSV